MRRICRGRVLIKWRAVTPPPFICCEFDGGVHVLRGSDGGSNEEPLSDLRTYVLSTSTISSASTHDIDTPPRETSRLHAATRLAGLRRYGEEQGANP